MKKLLVLILALFALLFVQLSFAADGDEISTNNFRVNSSGQVIQKVYVSVKTTSETLTAAQSGLTIVYKPASTQSTFTLPTATPGLYFRFIQASGDASALKKMVIDPQNTDSFEGCVASTTPTSFAAGDSLISTTSTGDAVTLIGGTNLWECVDRIGTWVDNN